MAEYQSVFEYSSSLVSAGTILFAATGFTAILVGVFLFQKSPLRRRNNLRAGLVVLWGTAFVVFSFFQLTSARAELNAIRAAEKAGQVEVCEGTVEILRNQDLNGHGPGDLVRVDGQVFEVRSTIETRTYATTAAEGGLLQEGSFVRIHFFKGRILKIEIPLTQSSPDDPQ